MPGYARHHMRKVLFLTLTLLAIAVADASAANPCVRPVPKQPPSATLLGQLGVLRAPATTDDRAPRDMLEGEGRPYDGAMRRVPLAIGGWVWVVPLYDVSGRESPTEACIRSAPPKLRRYLRRLKRAARGIARQEGLAISVYDAHGESHGGANGSIVHVREGTFVHFDGADADRRTRVIGLVPDGVASVRIGLDDLDTGKPKRVAETSAPVAENVFGVEVDVPFRGAFEADVTFLDAAGTVIGPEKPR